MAEHPEDALRRHAELTRRGFLKFAVGTAGLMIQPALAKTHRAGERSLAFYNLHTGERLRTPYWVQGEYIPDALDDINHILRDHRTGEVHPIDPRLLDILHILRAQLGSRDAFHVISGYRSPATNAMLHRRSNGVATKSLHMQGKAADISLPGSRLADLRRAALKMRAGGVGYYPGSGFVHVDTGRVRNW